MNRRGSMSYVCDERGAADIGAIRVIRAKIQVFR